MTLAEFVIRRVSELPDRTSPDESPELLTVYRWELEEILRDAQDAELDGLATEHRSLVEIVLQFKRPEVSLLAALCNLAQNHARTIRTQQDEIDRLREVLGQVEAATGAAVAESVERCKRARGKLFLVRERLRRLENLVWIDLDSCDYDLDLDGWEWWPWERFT